MLSCFTSFPSVRKHCKHTGHTQVKARPEFTKKEVPALCAGLSAGEAADCALQPPAGAVGSERAANAAGGAHSEPRAQTLAAGGVLRQGLCVLTELICSL